MQIFNLTLYALAALKEIGRAGPMKNNELARRLNMDKAYAAKTTNALSTVGLLNSERGPKGGFSLARPLDKIELVEAIDLLELTQAPIPQLLEEATRRKVKGAKDMTRGALIAALRGHVTGFVSDLPEETKVLADIRPRVRELLKKGLAGITVADI